MNRNATHSDGHFPEDISVVQRSCPKCGDWNESTLPGRYSEPPWTVIECRVCSFAYITAAPDYKELFEKLAWEKTSVSESERRSETRHVQQSVSKKTRWRLHLLPRRTMPEMLRAHAKPGNVVDLGCGDGGQLHGLADHFVPHGIEISRTLANEADASFRASGGFAVNAPCVEGLQSLPENFFTGASLRSYLEHELHPAPVLQALHRVLESDGVAIVKVPNYGSLNRRVMGKRWCGFRYPDHMNYFTPRTLSAMAEDCGFRIHFTMTGKLPTSDNMWAILRKQYY